MRGLGKGTVCVALLAAAGLAQGAVVDNFDAGNVIYAGPNFSIEAGLGANTLGGNRNTNLNVGGSSVEINDPGGSLNTSGMLAFSNDIGTASTLTLEYTAANADLIAGFNNGLVFQFLSADQPLTVKVTVNDGAEIQEVTKVKGIGPGNLAFLFDEFGFTDTEDSFESVDSVKVEMTPQNEFGGDYIVDLFESQNVPEPASLALLAAGGAMMLRRRR
jgi:hypothetical protein